MREKLIMSDEQKVVLTIEFENTKKLKDFMSWLSHSGEQNYWDSMAAMGNKKAVEDFRYDFVKNKIICT